MVSGTVAISAEQERALVSVFSEAVGIIDILARFEVVGPSSYSAIRDNHNRLEERLLEIGPWVDSLPDSIRSAVSKIAAILNDAVCNIGFNDVCLALLNSDLKAQAERGWRELIRLTRPTPISWAEHAKPTPNEGKGSGKAVVDPLANAKAALDDALDELATEFVVNTRLFPTNAERMLWRDWEQHVRAGREEEPPKLEDKPEYKNLRNVAQLVFNRLTKVNDLLRNQSEEDSKPYTVGVLIANLALEEIHRQEGERLLLKVEALEEIGECTEADRDLANDSLEYVTNSIHEHSQRADVSRLKTLSEAESGQFNSHEVRKMRGRVCASKGLSIDDVSAMTLDDFADAVTGTTKENKKRPKRSTQQGDAEAKLLAALSRHHKYADGSCLNFDPINSNELARQADVSKGSASGFFKKFFGGHQTYKYWCGKEDIVMALKMLNGEITPRILSNDLLKEGVSTGGDPVVEEAIRREEEKGI